MGFMSVFGKDKHKGSLEKKENSNKRDSGTVISASEGKEQLAGEKSPADAAYVRETAVKNKTIPKGDHNVAEIVCYADREGFDKVDICNEFNLTLEDFDAIVAEAKVNKIYDFLADKLKS